MKLRQALTQARSVLADNNIDDASIEGAILLRHVLGISRAQLFSDHDRDISPSQMEDLMKLVNRRARGEPSAYIIGRREFYSLDFKVNKHVLIPRPETELLVDKGISLCRKYDYSRIADIGTGCGAIAISLAINLPSVMIYATDISFSSLEVAQENCQKHKVTERVILLQGDMLEPLPEPVDMIIANLPYVRDVDIPSKGVLSFEPRIALSGGGNGLNKIEVLCHQAGEKLGKKGSLLLEIAQGQADVIKNKLNNIFPSASIKVQRDLAGIERVLCLSLT